MLPNGNSELQPLLCSPHLNSCLLQMTPDISFWEKIVCFRSLSVKFSLSPQILNDSLYLSCSKLLPYVSNLCLRHSLEQWCFWHWQYYVFMNKNAGPFSIILAHHQKRMLYRPVSHVKRDEALIKYICDNCSSRGFLLISMLSKWICTVI